MLVLSDTDVQRAAIGTGEAIRLVEDTFRLAGTAAVECPSRLELGTAGLRRFHGLAAAVPGHRAVGMRWIAEYPGNRDRRGVPDTTSTLILNDPDTGEPLCVMDGSWHSSTRTAAVTAVAARHLARPDARVLGLIGAGTLARAVLPTLLAVCPGLARVQVFARTESSRRRYCEDMASTFPRELVPVGSAREATSDADIIVSSTVAPPAPFLVAAWLAPGALVAPLEGIAAWETRLLWLVDKLVVDHGPQAASTLRAQRPCEDLPAPYADLGEVVTGKKPGRQTDAERIVTLATGHAATDMVLARAIYDNALTRGLGVRLALRGVPSSRPAPGEMQS
jgi:ornithine cyclodeaminase/alanine dehydrogenase-like protein (mu-crystallin family)